MAKKKKHQQGKEATPQRPKGRSKGRGGFLKIIFIALVVLIAGIVLMSMYGGKIFDRVKGVSAPQKTTQMDILVFFGDEEGMDLKAEKRSIKKSSIEGEIKEAVNSLISGPANKTLTPTMPQGATLKGVSVKDSTLYADFSMELQEAHQGGSTGEMLTVYSIVETIAFNFPSIKGVQILIEGKTAETLAGHIDISVPIAPRIKRPKAEV
ncbi:MAG: GerMN domain-containing protein [Deltaproteobacteria bacterium]